MGSARRQPITEGLQVGSANRDGRPLGLWASVVVAVRSPSLGTEFVVEQWLANTAAKDGNRGAANKKTYV